MKKTLLLLLTSAIGIGIHAQPKPFLDSLYYYIENPHILEWNQEPGHTPSLPVLRTCNGLGSENYGQIGVMSLNGKWKFKWFETPDLITPAMVAEKTDDRDWISTVVPSNWEMKGFGDPQFRNVQQPFAANPPHIPRDFNPTGLYRTNFTIPDGWKERKIYLRTEAITSASFIWINGKQAGFNKGANEPAEYDITEFLHKGKNQITIMVTKYSDGSYLEDQDFWRLSGIFREVYLVSRPFLQIKDVQVITDLDSAYKDASLQMMVDIANTDASHEQKVRLHALLFDRQKKLVAEVQTKNLMQVSGGASMRQALSVLVNKPFKWSDENPYLYTLKLILLNESGDVIEAFNEKIGFKKVEIRKQVLLVNGAPVKLNGVNSHMQHPLSGHAMDTATIRKDFILMKQFNINCVRTSHYPPPIAYLDLADEYGLYIVDETGDEAHATEYISGQSLWTSAYVERAQKMVLRDRNHASILFWSAGNESGTGNNICQLIQEGKRLDPSRPWMYGGNTFDVGWSNEVPCEDIIGPRYPTPAELELRIAMVPESQDPRPSFMDEYLAATGNSLGGLDEYWKVIRKYPRCSGGAIWDWVSPGIREDVRILVDESPLHINTAVKGRAKLIPGKFGNAIQLNGHDQWIDVYRDPSLDDLGSAFSIAVWIKPGPWNGNGTYLSKGNFEIGIQAFRKDSLELYLSTGRKVSVKGPLPANWEGSWHQLAATYDGKMATLFVDGKMLASKSCSGNINAYPFPLNLGRNPELDGQEFSGYTSNAAFDQLVILDTAVNISTLLDLPVELKKHAKLWLSMDKLEEKGWEYGMGIGGRTYGLIWPDRKPQPELWQVKKSAQPVGFDLIDPGKGIVKIHNYYQFTDLSMLQGLWQMQEDGDIIQQGTVDLSLTPGHDSLISIPFKRPRIKSGKDYQLFIGFSLKEKTCYAEKGFEVAWEQFSLPWRQEETVEPMPSSEKIHMDETGDYLSLYSKNFRYGFNKHTGRLDSLVYLGKNLLQAGPIFTPWRAPLANERDAWAILGAHLVERKEGFGEDPANSWRNYGLDRLNNVPAGFNWEQNDDGSITVTINEIAEGSSFSTTFMIEWLWKVFPDGTIELNNQVLPQGYMPAWLPKMGLQWFLPATLKKVTWYGRGPFENYPDRKSGARIGMYSSTVEQMFEPYLIPQDYGCRCDVSTVRLINEEGIGLEFSSTQNFQFSARNYSTDNLSRARYPYQLNTADGIWFNFDYAVSGVGCTAISVLNQYKVYPAPVSFKLKIKPINIY